MSLCRLCSSSNPNYSRYGLATLQYSVTRRRHVGARLASYNGAVTWASSALKLNCTSVPLFPHILHVLPISHSDSITITQPCILPRASPTAIKTKSESAKLRNSAKQIKYQKSQSIAPPKRVVGVLSVPRYWDRGPTLYIGVETFQTKLDTNNNQKRRRSQTKWWLDHTLS